MTRREGGAMAPTSSYTLPCPFLQSLNAPGSPFPFEGQSSSPRAAVEAERVLAREAAADVHHRRRLEKACRSRSGGCSGWGKTSSRSAESGFGRRGHGRRGRGRCDFFAQPINRANGTDQGGRRLRGSRSCRAAAEATGIRCRRRSAARRRETSSVPSESPRRAYRSCANAGG